MPKRAEPKSTPRQTQSWWLAEGDELCSHCGHYYHYEREIRCPECDGPLCPGCVVRVEGVIVCPDCAPTPR